jgi:ketosteroid isomerase-like protein
MTSNAERAAILSVALHAGMRGDRDALSGLYTDDVKVWTPALSGSSAAELMEELDRRDDAFSEMELEVTPLDVGGDYAAAEWRVAMTHSGDLEVRDGIVAPTGLRISINGVSIAEFRGDRICALRQYWDEIAVFEQLGLLDRGGDTG